MSTDPERIVVNPAVMSGRPVVRGTRVTVERVLSLLAQGLALDELLKEYPQLTEADVRACLAYAASLAGKEEVLPFAEPLPR